MTSPSPTFRYAGRAYDLEALSTEVSAGFDIDVDDHARDLLRQLVGYLVGQRSELHILDAALAEARLRADAATRSLTFIPSGLPGHHLTKEGTG